MKSSILLFCLVILSHSVALAQDVELHAPQSSDGLFAAERQQLGSPNSSYQRTETPQQLVHRNAALRAAQRRERMAINARFGYSPSRPPASPMPFMGSPIPRPTGYGIYTPYPGFAFPRGYIRF